MGPSKNPRRRTKPDEPEESDEGIFESAGEAKEKFRSRVKEYKDRNEFPIVPLYSVGEIVYLPSPGRAQQPAGPYVVVSVSAERYYTIKQADNGQLYSHAVAESQLLIPTR